MSSAYDAVDGTSVGAGEDGPQPCAAGVYTSSVLVPLVAHILDSYGALDKLEAFISTNGRKFYGVPARAGDEVKLRKVDVQSQEAKSVPGFYKKEGRDGSIVDVVPFMAGKKLSWELVNA
jgi:dihydroorotase